MLNLDENEKTFFDIDADVAATTLDANGTNFSANDYVVLGKLGVEKSEIVKLSAADSTSLTCGATVFAHNRGDLITFIPYNQIIMERSTDGGSTWTPLAAVNIQADNADTLIQRPSDGLTDMYRVRFYNSTTTNYSDYSDTVLATGYADNSVFSLKKRALEDMGERIGDEITDEWLNGALWEGRRDVDKEQTKWAWRTHFNADLGDIIPGRYTVALPSDYRDPQSNDSMLSLRLGRNDRPLTYQDRNRFNQNYRNIAHSRLLSAITAVSTSIQLNSTGDFDDSGSIYIAAEGVTGTIDLVTYTGNNKATNTLTGVTGITDSHAVARDVWQGGNFGQPSAYTINNGNIEFDIPFENNLAAENIKADYYGELVEYNSDADILDEPEFDLYVNWLKYKIKYKKSNGTLDVLKDPDYILYLKGLKSLVEANLLGQEIHLVPDFND